MRFILTIFILTSALLVLSQKQHNTREVTLEETWIEELADTPTRKIPVFVITIPQQQLYKMFDTSNAIMSYHGMELGKTTSRKHESLMANQWNRLLEYAKPDTIKVKGGKP